MRVKYAERKYLTFIVWCCIIWTQGEYTSGTWAEKSQEINFADFKFYISHYFLKQECEEDDGKDNLEEGRVTLSALLSTSAFHWLFVVNDVDSVGQSCSVHMQAVVEGPSRFSEFCYQNDDKLTSRLHTLYYVALVFIILQICRNIYYY